MPLRTAQLRQALWITTLIATWWGRPPASADDRPYAGAPAPGAFNAAPPFIPAPDRSAIEEELGATMSMTPPDRRVMAELPSGSRLWIRPGAYEPGPSGSDCRRFDYEYEAIGGGTAVVVGARCKYPAAATWHALSQDVTVDVRGLERFEPPAPAAAGGDDIRGEPDRTAPAEATEAPAPTQARPPAAQRPSQPAATAPPARVILPFTPSR